MKRKILLGICLIVFSIGICFLFHYIRKGEEEYQIEEYVLYDGNLNINNQTYTECELAVEAITLDEQIGVTQDGKQIFAISDLDKENFLCLRMEGEERIYRNVTLNPMTELKALKAYKLVFREDGAAEDYVTFEDEEIINEFLGMIQDENIVLGEVAGDVFYDATLYSKKYKGICYKYSYVIDENGEEYVYDNSLSTAWKFSTHMFDVKLEDD